VPRSSRVWLDTDPACGAERTADPDDCLAILLAARSPQIQLAGISTVFGNAPVAVTDRTARTLADLLQAGAMALPVTRGAERALDRFTDPAGAIPAPAALARALEAGPLTILALGPLTNVALLLRTRPELTGRIVRVVAVMGRRPGHVFHPSEGHGRDAMLLGHGPVFRDLNLASDPAAAAAVLASGVPVTLVPYDVAREITITAADLAGLERSGEDGAWVAARSRGWLDFWRADVGLDGFYPFDAVAVFYLTDPWLFACGPVEATVRTDESLGWVGRMLGRATGLLVGPPGTDPLGGSRTLYCPAARAALLHRSMVERMISPTSAARPP
jgi:purine nucleosidase